MMSNSSSTTFGNGLQQHNLTAAIDYLNQNGPSPLPTYPNVSRTENALMLDKQTTATFFAPSTNPSSYYSTQLVTQTPSTILITNNFGGPDESSTISGVNNNFNNSSIRIVTHNNNNNNNNNNTHHTNNNNNNNNNNAKVDEVTNDKQQHYHHLHHLHHQASPLALQHSSSISPPSSVTMPNSLVNASTVVSAPAAPVPGMTNTSTVVLDRINICINNHYGDASTIPPSVVTPQSGTLCSPIIPPLTMTQHTTTVDGIVSIPSTCVGGTVATAKLNDASNLEMHVDEPDSTTTTHCHSNSIPMELDDQDEHLDLDKAIEFDIFTMQKFVIGEDALVKRRDGRYYLGTVVDIHRQQYLVQFDDKTDYWSNVDELMKLSSEIISKNKPTCLSCKQENENDVVEICERCGRGYHRQCTREVTSKSGEWMCKRCVKPMKLSLEDDPNEKLKQKTCKYSMKQLPYELSTLTWDEKHRVNLEQTYCYCGKSGQFDNNMIQCCKCKQWFHAHCVECVKTLFRGDVFFIFGCSVCNDGKEFLRRIEIDWADLVHLILYNMSLSKNFQKYHHLHKNIYPFAIEKRDSLQLPKSMLKLSDSEFKASILKTLLSHPKLFQCGKEIKKDHSAWGLRSNKPPQGPIYDIKRDEVLCNQLISEKLKINILPHNEEDEQTDEYQEESPREFTKDETILPAAKTKINLHREDDDKFTSDDEIPIKLILDKVKRSNSTLDLRETTKSELQDDIVHSNQSYNHRSIDKEIKEKQEDSIEMVKFPQKSSRKRKAFTLSKGYKDSDKSNDLPRSICDSSSDENSSSSRGTLDLIIPPPKDFLGLNNPFRMVTPKKCDDSTAKSTGITRKTVSFGSNALDLNSKIAALKGSGIFPNISNSDIAKAAGQPRLVRTIKRRLSAKDIVIGPNQEVRRRRTRALSTNVEIISTTTINSIPSNFFPIRATVPESSNSTNSSKATTSSSQSNSPHITSSASSSLDGLQPSNTVTTHGRRLRKRPEKSSPQNSRRNSISSSSSSISSSGPASSQQQFALPPPSQTQNAVPISDLKKSVNKYFGAANRIENGEKFTIRAKRRLTNGQMQYLFEWES